MSGAAKPPRHSLSGAFRKRSASTSGQQIPLPLRPGNTRRSSIYGKGSSVQPKQDPRPINDKAFQKECMSDLVYYLTSHGYNSPISSKLPTGKEIKDIIEFLFRQYDPNMVLGKLEEDVPAFFKSICYPFQISKSALYAAGSPHSWPGLLAALAWLVHLLRYDERAAEIRAESGEGGRFFDYICSGYHEFLAGNDEHVARLDNEFREEYLQAINQVGQQNEELEKNVAELQAKLHSMNAEPSTLSVLEARKADYVSDISKFTNMISTLQSHKDATINKLEEKKHELVSLKAETQAVTEENQALKERIGAQEISVAGVEKMDKESQILDSNIEAVTIAAQGFEKEAWNNEIQSAKMLRELETAINGYNAACARLRSLAGETEDSQSEYEIKLNSRAEKPEEILGKDVKAMIKPVVEALMEQSEKAIRDAREEILVLQKKVYADEVAHQAKLDQVTNQKAQNKKIETLYKGKKEKVDKYIKSKDAERARLEADLASDEETMKAALNEASERLKKTNKEYEETLSRCTETIREKQAIMMDDLQFLIEYKEKMQRIFSKTELVADETAKMAASSVSSVRSFLQLGYSSIAEV